MTYLDHIDYLTQLGHAHKQIKSVVIGDFQDIADKERAEIQYPCLWIESPESQFVGDNDAFEEQKSGAFVVLQNGDPKDEDKRKYNLEQTYRIARSIALRMIRDYSYLRYTIKNKRLSMIESIYNDYDQGWRFTFDQIASLQSLECYNSAEWDETVSPISRISFTLTLTTTTATVVVDPLPAGFTAVWKLKVNNTTVNPGSYEATKVFNITSGDNVFIELEATSSGGHVRKASVFESIPGVYKSIPFSYNKYR